MEKEGKGTKVECPICGSLTLQQYAIRDPHENEGIWGHCYKGHIFNANEFSHKKYSKKNIKQITKQKEVERRYEHYIRCYMPLIEEAVMTRMFLDIGNMTTNFMKSVKKRGWVPYGIDKQHYGNKGGIVADFELHDFKEMKFGCIFMSHVFEEFQTPLKTLDKAISLLDKMGVLFLSTADIDNLFVLGKSRWFCWDAAHVNVFFNMQSLKFELEKRGLDVILCRKNLSDRFVYSDDFHVIAQKKVL